MSTSALLGEIREEFEDSDLGDWRLRQRLVAIAESLDVSPEKTLPKATKTTAAREAAYRFFGNFRVTADRILAPHRRATAKRCRDAGRVYVVSDTTEFKFSGQERGVHLGRLHGESRGFLGHFALAVSADGRRCPLGILGINQVVRSEEKQPRGARARKRNPTRESVRWGAMVDEAQTVLGEGVEAIHVMDREADIYELLADLTTNRRKFIIRCAHNRMVEDGKLFDAIENSPVMLSRDVALSHRRKKEGRRRMLRGDHPLRAARTAALTISSRRIVIKRAQTSCAAYPRTIAVNVVRVHERNPPDGEQAIEWVLLSSEAISTADEVAAIVDGYRTRWTIEEYFKALKTGCAYEHRQLQSLEALGNSLAIFAVIAWRLLLLRSLHRDAPSTPATQVLDPILLDALSALLKHNGEKRCYSRPVPPSPRPSRASLALAPT